MIWTLEYLTCKVLETYIYVLTSSVSIHVPKRQSGVPLSSKVRITDCRPVDGNTDTYFTSEASTVTSHQQKTIVEETSKDILNLEEDAVSAKEEGNEQETKGRVKDVEERMIGRREIYGAASPMAVCQSLSHEVDYVMQSQDFPEVNNNSGITKLNIILTEKFEQ